VLLFANRGFAPATEWAWVVPVAKSGEKARGAPIGTASKVNVVAGSPTELAWIRGLGFLSCAKGPPWPSPTASSLPTLPGTVPTWTGEAGASPAHPSCRWRPREARSSRRACLIRLPVCGLAFRYALAGPLPGLLGGALATLASAPPALTSLVNHLSAWIIAASWCWARSDQTQHRVMFSPLRFSTVVHPRSPSPRNTFNASPESFG